MDELERYRQELDEINAEIHRLFVKRMEISEKVAAYKVENNLPIYQKNRENQILQKLDDQEEKYGKYTKALFKKMMELSRARQNEVRGFYGLLGEKLSHSYSIEIHEALGCPNYNLVEAEEDELENVLGNGEYLGFNVTIPYKRKILEYCAEWSEEVKDIQSANTLVKQVTQKEDGTMDYHWVAHNTDVLGFQDMMKFARFDLNGQKVVILGAGGVAMAVAYAAHVAKAREVVLVSRKGRDNFSNLDRHYDAEVIVNATPVGMAPNLEDEIVDLRLFSKCKAVVDLIYNPHRTRLLQKAETIGIPCIGGLYMLVAQAAHAETLFWGKEFDAKTIRSIYKKLSFEKRNLVLIGMPGCGKSVIAKAIGKMSGRQVVDLDEEIEKQVKKSAEQLIWEKGEAYFRTLETEVLKKVCQMKGIILATGGGTPLTAKNKQLLKADGYVYYISRDIRQLDMEGRPLSSDDTIETLYRKRLPHYQACMDTFFINDSTVSAIAQKIWMDFEQNA
ncbi:MAG: shikimate kinase [Lachnospiraceae bacterium]|nr:shikimate kinase [Lachnospiraceae bacterium]